MKKVLAVTVLLLFISITGYSQFGVTGGINLSSLRIIKDYPSDGAIMRIGAHIGGFYEVRLFNNFYLQPQLLFSYDPTSVKRKLDNGQDVIDTRNGYYLNLPVMLSYKIPIKESNRLGFDFGAYWSHGLFGRGKVIRPDDSGDRGSAPLFEYGGYNDLGLIGGVRYELNDYIFSARTRYGLNDVTLLLMLSVGYKFGK
ncbi:MAG: porin family protein [Dysgonomonas sp.]|uniref:porin family protein n=1 Tax=Dysgonomonas sp. TaxID=1891233 RepID=UPI003A84C879